MSKLVHFLGVFVLFSFFFGLKYKVMSMLPDLHVLGERLVGSQFDALVPSHTDLEYKQSCKKLTCQI